MRIKFFSILILSGLFCSCVSNDFDPKLQLDYCLTQASKTMASLADYQRVPKDITDTSVHWNTIPIKGWTCGFWPGILWYLYEYSREDSLRCRAECFTSSIEVVTQRPIFSHDMGFVLTTSMGNGYRLTSHPHYRDVMLRGADSLASLFNPKVGTILSWPSRMQKWPHNTIIDNMMNLELLFWAAKNGGSDTLAKIAITHAKTTMMNHFRDDLSAYHVVVYDPQTGVVKEKITHQGYSDHSMWARGQAWAIYGYTMCYRETGDLLFLDFAQKVAEPYLARLPQDAVPYWDFDDPAIPDAPRDASAAAIAASALLELSGYVENPEKAQYYREQAVEMLTSLSSSAYQSRDCNDAFLLHSTGNKNRNVEVDASIIYADYYYLEALLRYYKMLQQEL